VYLSSEAGMASARLQITVESACNLYNSDGVLAGKSDPYVIVEVPGQEGMKFQTQVISNELNPVWNFTGEIDGFMDGDVLRFTVMDKDTFPKPDDFLGTAALTAQDFYPNGFQGEVMLADSKTQATLSVMVSVIGCDEEEEAPLELVEAGGVQMAVPGESVEEAMVAGSSSAAVYAADAGDGSTMLGNSSTVMYSGIPAGGSSASGLEVSSTGPAALASGVAMQGLPIVGAGVPNTTSIPSHSMTYSSPQTYSAPQVPMNGMVTTSVVASQSMANQFVTYAAPQAPVPCQSVTYAAPQAPVPSQSVTATIVHPPVTVTAEEFARLNGTLVTEPSPMTVGIETVGVETNQEVVVNDTKAVDKVVKVRKKKNKQCC
jgi:hypothetical protein